MNELDAIDLALVATCVISIISMMFLMMSLTAWRSGWMLLSLTIYYDGCCWNNQLTPRGVESSSQQHHQLSKEHDSGVVRAHPPLLLVDQQSLAQSLSIPMHWIQCVLSCVFVCGHSCSLRSSDLNGVPCCYRAAFTRTT